jgi:ABC-2 type transport system permease protein
MNARPGSALWLLKHELRLAWFNAGGWGKKGAARRGPGRRGIISFAVLWLLLHAAAFAALRALPSTGLLMVPPLLFGVTVILASVFTLMLSSGLKASVEALFDRGDLDLLLSSPLPSRSIFVVRLLAIVAAVAGMYLFFLAPIANVGALLGQFRWLGIYPVVAATGALAASLAMLLTLGLVRLLGARRTRVVAQVIGAFAGAFMFLMSQVFNYGVHDQQAELTGKLMRWLGPGGTLSSDSALWMPAKAVLGAPLPLLELAALAVGVLALTVYSTHRFFVHGLQQAASIGRVPAAPAGGLRFQFGRSLAHTVLVKEWRLIARDPHLISQILLQLLYLVPLFVLVFTHKEVRLTAIGAAFTMLSASLAASLAWIIIQAEDAPDLLSVSPASTFVIRSAKLAAAAMPPLALVSLPLLWLTTRAPLAGVLACFTVVGAVFGACLIVMWSGRPGERGAFKTRGGRGNAVGGFLELTNTLAWAGLSYLLQGSVGATPPDWAPLVAGALFILTLVAPLLAWLVRGRARA